MKLVTKLPGIMSKNKNHPSSELPQNILFENLKSLPTHNHLVFENDSKSEMEQAYNNPDLTTHIFNST